MKPISYLITLIPLFSCMNSSSAGAQKDTAVTAVEVSHKQTGNGFNKLFTLADAEKILGEPATLTDSVSSAGSIATYNCTYTAKSKDEKTGKTGIIYVMFEDYPTVDDAHKSYLSIKTANQKNGIETLQGIGDEAYFHTDNTNFYFILSRKGTKMLRMKVNKTTSHTSKDAFNKVGRDVTEGM